MRIRRQRRQKNRGGKYAKIEKGDFILTMQDESMSGKRIHAGEDVIFTAKETAENGEIIAVAIKGKTYCRKYEHHNGKHLFLAMNPQFKTIVIDETDASSFSVLGIATGAIIKLGETEK